MEPRYPLVVPRNKPRQLLALAGLLGFFGVSLMVAKAILEYGYRPWVNNESIAFNITGTVGPIMFGALALMVIPELFKKDPILSISEEGLYIGSKGFGLMPWSEIDGFSEGVYGRHRFLVVKLVDPEVTASRLEPAQVKRLEESTRLYGGLMVQGAYFGMSVSDFIVRTKPFVQRQIAAHGKPPIVGFVPTP